MNQISRRRFGRLAMAAGVVAIGAPAFGQDRAALIEGARKEGKLAVATSAPGDGFPKFLESFKAKYPFIDVTTGFYTAPTGRVLSRVMAELQSGNVNSDVMHIANSAPYIDLARKGMLLQYMSPEYAAHQAGSHDNGYWGSARVIGVIMAYNKNKLPAEQAPKAWVDLLKPEFKGKKIAIQNAAAGTAFNQFYMLERVLGVDFIKKLAAQEPVIMPTSGQVSDAMIRGEVLVGATVDHWRAFEESAVKAGIVGVYPTEGMPIAVAPVAILKGAPNPNAAKLFMDYVLSQEGQTRLNTEIYGVYSMRADVKAPPGQKALADTKPLIPTDLADYEKAAAAFPQKFESWFK
ncbi:MAG: extracellular solute-binding protein [Alphaproteobacteria bacterium]|nr:extracellular solute-binding protein [Alphaproteobacteria bacterium]